MNVHLSNAVRACAAAAALILVGCESSSAPSPPFTTLAGQWSTQDTIHWTFAWVADGTPSVHVLVNQLHATVTVASDSTYTFGFVGGVQLLFDSAVGQPASRSTNPVNGGPAFTALVRNDTAFLEGLGTMLLSHATASSINSQRTLPTPECLVDIGPIARPSPAPSCYVAFHWTRIP